MISLIQFFGSFFSQTINIRKTVSFIRLGFWVIVPVLIWVVVGLVEVTGQVGVSDLQQESRYQRITIRKNQYNSI